MSEPVTFTAQAQALAQSVRRYCADHGTDQVQRSGSANFPGQFWAGLAALGVWALAMPDEEGGAGEVAAACRELGLALAPGPVAATVFAAHTLPAASAEPVAAGESLVSCGSGPLMPWAPLAEVFVEQRGDQAWLARPAGPVEPVDTLGNEPWGRVALDRVHPLERVRDGLDLARVALAGYLWGAGRRLLDAAAEHARTRVQFSRPIGDFQAVAHPIVNSGLALQAAENLLTVAAQALDQQHPQGSALAAAARLSASRAAMDAAFVAHQTHGAMGYTLEGPVGHVAQRIRQLALVPSHEADGGEQVLAMYARKGQV